MESAKEIDDLLLTLLDFDDWLKVVEDCDDLREWAGLVCRLNVLELVVIVTSGGG